MKIAKQNYKVVASGKFEDHNRTFMYSEEANKIIIIIKWF